MISVLTYMCVYIHRHVSMHSVVVEGSGSNSHIQNVLCVLEAAYQHVKVIGLQGLGELR